MLLCHFGGVIVINLSKILNLSNIEWQSSIGLLIVCFLIALVFTGILYFRNRTFSEQAPAVRMLLPLLRFLGIFGILLLLLDPLIKTISNDEIKPILLIAQDASQSIAARFDTTEVRKLIEKVEDSELSGKYDIHTLSFSDNIENGTNYRFSGESTDLSMLMNYIDDQYQGRNLSATLLLSDGIFNQGSHPFYSVGKLSAPIFSMALGDTTQEKDLRLVDVFHNETNLLGDDFEVQLDWQAHYLSGEKSKLQIRRISPSPKKIFEKNLSISSNDNFKSERIEISGEIEGLHHYRAILNTIDGEKNTSNNVKDFYIEIIDSKVEILLLARAPHPDLGMFERIVSNSKNYKLNIIYEKNLSEVTENKYDLIVYHDLPSSNPKLKSHFERVKKMKIPYLFVLGPRSDIALFNEWQQVVDVKRKSKQINLVQGKINDDFQAFELNELEAFPWNSSPPISSIFGDFSLNLGGQSLLNQKIGQVETEYPLIAINDKPVRHGVLTGVNWWKLRMFEYLSNQEQVKIDLLFTKLFQYLSLKEDKRPLVVKSSKKLYNSNESIVLNAILRNDNYEPVNKADLRLSIKNQEGKVYEFLMDREKDTYRLDIGSLPASNYSYSASTEYNKKKYSAAGKFSIQNVQLESNLLQANHRLLKQLSEGTGGETFYADQSDQMIEKLQSEEMGKVLLAENIRLSQLIDKKWILFALAFLLFVEWIIRKYFGSY